MPCTRNSSCKAACKLTSSQPAALLQKSAVAWPIHSTDHMFQFYTWPWTATGLHTRLYILAIPGSWPGLAKGLPVSCCSYTGLCMLCMSARSPSLRLPTPFAKGTEPVRPFGRPSRLCSSAICKHRLPHGVMIPLCEV